MSEQKKNQTDDLGELQFSEEITYMPCRFCGSNDYDLFEGSLTPDNILMPEGCDCCGFGLKNRSGITIH
jgi:ribosomal protein L37E